MSVIALKILNIIKVYKNKKVKEVKNMEFEIKAKIWDMTDGKTIKIMYNDEVFVLEEKVQQTQPQVQPSVVKETIEIEPIEIEADVADVTKVKPNLGEVIAYQGTQSIHKGVSDDIKKGLDENKSDTELFAILEKWHPGTKDSTKGVYLSAYRSYLVGSKYTERKEKDTRLAVISGVNIIREVLDDILGADKGVPVDDIIRNHYPNIKNKSVTKYASCYRKYIKTKLGGHKLEKKPKKKQSRKHYKPNDVIGFDDTYESWIKKDEYDAVIRAIRTWKFKGTVKNIQQKTRLNLRRVYAVLHWMLDNNEAYKNYDRETSETIYLPESGKETKVSYP